MSAQKEALDDIKEVKDFDSFRQKIQKDDHVRHKKQKGVESFKYHGTGQRQCPAYSKTCSRCSKTNHFRFVCKLKQRQQLGKKIPKSGRSVHVVR